MMRHKYVALVYMYAMHTCNYVLKPLVTLSTIEFDLKKKFLVACDNLVELMAVELHVRRRSLWV
jgi:hypothetical protein